MVFCFFGAVLDDDEDDEAAAPPKPAPAPAPGPGAGARAAFLVGHRVRHDAEIDAG